MDRLSNGLAISETFRRWMSDFNIVLNSFLIPLTSRIYPQINFSDQHFWLIDQSAFKSPSETSLRPLIWSVSDKTSAEHSEKWTWELKTRYICVYFVFEPNKAQNYGPFWAIFSSEDPSLLRWRTLTSKIHDESFTHRADDDSTFVNI